MSTNSVGWSVKSDVPKVVLFTGQDHLNEVLESQAAIFIRVKELDQPVALALSCSIVAVISDKV